MSNPSNTVLPSGFESDGCTLIAADTTAARVLVEPRAAIAATTTSPLFFGGATLLDATLSSTSAVATNVTLYKGNVRTVVGTNTGVAATTTGTMTRTTGSFISDGWQPGKLAMLFNDKAVARQGVEGILCIVTAVSSTTLTLNGTPLTALTLSTGCRICEVFQLATISVPANAGNSASIPSVQLLGSSNWNSSIGTESKLGITELLAIAAATTIAALPAHISGVAQVAKY